MRARKRRSRSRVAKLCRLDAAAKPDREILFDMIEEVITDASIGKRWEADRDLIVRLFNLERWLGGDRLLSAADTRLIGGSGMPRAEVIRAALEALPRERLDALLALPRRA